MTSWESTVAAQENAATGEMLERLDDDLGGLGDEFPRLFGLAAAVQQEVRREFGNGTAGAFGFDEPGSLPRVQEPTALDQALAALGDLYTAQAMWDDPDVRDKRADEAEASAHEAVTAALERLVGAGNWVEGGAPPAALPVPPHDQHTEDGPAGCPRCSLLRDGGLTLDAAREIEDSLSAQRPPVPRAVVGRQGVIAMLADFGGDWKTLDALLGYARANDQTLRRPALISMLTALVHSNRAEKSTRKGKVVYRLKLAALEQVEADRQV